MALALSTLCPRTWYPEAEATHEEVIQDESLFLKTLQSFLDQLNVTLKVPRVGGKEVNMHMVYTAVTALGGFDMVTMRKYWMVVCEPFKFPASCTNQAFVIKKLYQTSLQRYEEVYFHRCEGPIPAPALDGSNIAPWAPHEAIRYPSAPAAAAAAATAVMRLEASKQNKIQQQAASLTATALRPGTWYPQAQATHEEVIQDRRLFLRTLQSFSEQLKVKIRVPKVSGVEVDTHLLYKEVTALGGFDLVVNRKQWTTVCEPFNFPTSFTNKAFVVKKLYISLLQRYEDVYFHGCEGPIPTDGSYAGCMAPSEVVRVAKRKADDQSESRPAGPATAPPISGHPIGPSPGAVAQSSLSAPMAP